MCVSNDAKTKEETIVNSQIIEKEHEVNDSMLASNTQLHHEEIGNHSGQSLIETSTASQLQSEERKLLSSSKDELSPQLTSSVSKDHEIVHRLSPKKKRSRDQIEELKEQDRQVLEKSEIEQEKHANPIRASSSEPEKKRPRDATEPTKTPINEKEAKFTTLQAPMDVEKAENLQKNKKDDNKSDNDSDPTSAESLEKPKLVFANSGFASLAASSVSPFGSLGLTKSSVFGGGLNNKYGTDSSKMSSNVILSNASSTSDNLLGKGASTPLSFGDKTVTSTGSESVFSSVFSNSGFSSNSGPKLSSFATPGAEINIPKTKETRAFGAPEIGNESDSEASNSHVINHTKNNDNKKNDSVGHEEILKSKIKIDDGEADEVTLLQIRAKLFAIESKTVGWKERGVGTLKINVTKQSVKYDKNGIPISGTFNKSNKKEKNKSSKNNACTARLIMRQENTHRVVLNTFILREMEFEEKPAVSSAQFLFTAFEGEKELKPVRLLLKMSEINAKLFRAEIDFIQSKL